MSLYVSFHFARVPRTALKPETFIATIFLLVVLLVPAQVNAALININTAGSEELQTLDGIGEVKAQAIIDYRETYGSFAKKEDIMNVSGIGEVTYNNIKNDITVGTSGDGDTDDNSESYTSSTTTTSKSSVKEPRVPVGGLVIYAPEIGYVNQSIKFDAEPTDGTDGRLIRYQWNFGDAATADSKSPEHSYAYPGTYVVIVESYYDKKEVTARHEINILSAAVTLVRNLNGDVTVKNENSHEIDLDGMKLVGQSVFEFPEYTILMPGKSLVISNSKLDAGANNVVTLHDEFGNVMASTYKPLAAAPARVTSVASHKNQAQDLTITDDRETATTSVNANESVNVATDTEAGLNLQSAAAGEAGRRLPEGSLPYLGLIGVISLSLLALYGSRSNVTK